MVSGQLPEVSLRGEDPYVAALRNGGGPLYMCRSDGGYLTSSLEHWWEPPCPADMSVLHRCRGAVLDIGCGPGRFVTALHRLGRPVTGIDTCRHAVRWTARHGGRALCVSVFDRLPGEGRWHTALLMDGNIGIGGDPAALLGRVAELVTPAAGMLLVEAAERDVDERLQVRFDDGRGSAGPVFPWSRTGVPALRRTAVATGWDVTHQWESGGRHFLELRRCPGAGSGSVPGPQGAGGQGRRDG